MASPTRWPKHWYTIARYFLFLLLNIRYNAQPRMTVEVNWR